MSDRRPHWTDELIEAVQQADEIDCKVRYCDDCTYAVIAAVEDWARWEHVPKGTLRRLEQAEAAIARVRDLHCLDGPDGPEDVEHCQECGYISIDAEPCPTLLALDGPQ